MNTVYNATTGICMLDNATDDQFDRWYDHHAEYRKVILTSRVNPEFRDLYEATRDRPGVHWVVEAGATA